MMTTSLAAAVLATILVQLPEAGEYREDVKFTELGDEKIGRSDRKRHGWRWSSPRIKLEEESFTVLAPAGYSADRPHGLLVYISPGRRGWMLSRRLGREQLSELLDRRQMLYVGPNNVQNKRPDIRRAKELLDHDPKIVLEEGVPETIEWMKRVYSP